MKKLLLITSFLASQLFAVECAKEQYSPYFDYTGRYLYSSSSPLGDRVFDKNSIIYDKTNKTIKVWSIGQVKANYEEGLLKVYWELDIKNNNQRVIQEIHVKCNGEVMEGFETNVTNWTPIVPEGLNERLLNKVKNYLNIK